MADVSVSTEKGAEGRVASEVVAAWPARMQNAYRALMAIEDAEKVFEQQLRDCRKKKALAWREFGEAAIEMTTQRSELAKVMSTAVGRV